MKKDEDQKKNRAKRRVLPSLLVAGSLVVPGAAAAGELARSVTLGPEPSNRPLVLDSQTAWGGDDLRPIFQAQWAEVTWGQVTWARAGTPFNRNP